MLTPWRCSGTRKRYLLEPPGQRHYAMYRKERDEVTRFWAEIKKTKQEGKQITGMVLEKLLPYNNTCHNGEKDYQISVAPAGDWNSLASFEANQEVSRGIKSGIITSTLYFLNPQYRIIKNKTIDTINFLLGRNAIGRDLSRYRECLETIDQAVDDLGMPLFDDANVFDAFCHWMCDKRLGGYARIEKPIEVPEDEEDDPTAFEEEIEPQNHWEAIYYLVKTGNLLGYKTYVADPSRSAFDKKLGEIATLAEVPPILRSAPEISRIDVIWYRSIPPFFLF